MTTYQVERVIPVSPETVWNCLTDASALASGPCGITRLEGRIAAGEKITLWSEVSGSRPFRLTVRRFEPHRHMQWHGGLPFGLFKGIRTFELSEVQEGTGFYMQETFSGPLSPLISRSIPDLGTSFETFADGLTQLAKERSR